MMHLSKNYYLSLLLALFPISFIAGNMIININLILLIASSIILFKSDLFKIKFFLLDKLLILYFILIILTGLINDLYFFSEKMAWKGYFSTIIKSIFFLRYLFFYIVVRYLVEKKILNLKFFFISCSFGAVFVSLDVLYQFINGKDIFGYEIIEKGRKLGGPFDNELIAGSFIQRFSFFSFFLVPVFFSEKSKKYSKFLVPLLMLVFFIGIILSGNRMPLILFVFTTILIFIFQREVRKFILPTILSFIIIFFLMVKTNTKVKDNFFNFYIHISKMTSIIITQDYTRKDTPIYLKEFASFYDTWQMNKFIGGGLKNFRYYCHERPNIDRSSGYVCNMHPHNYYLEILTETGIIGFFLVSFIFLNILFISFYKKYFSKDFIVTDHAIVPFIFLFIAEILPFKSTGSFFTTGNTTYLFLIIAILIGLTRRYNLNDNKSKTIL